MATIKRLTKNHIDKQIKVTWDDHHEFYGPVTKEEAKDRLKPYVGVACGTLVAFNKQMMIVSSNVWPGDDCYDGAVFSIIRINVTLMETIE